MSNTFVDFAKLTPAHWNHLHSKLCIHVCTPQKINSFVQWSFSQHQFWGEKNVSHEGWPGHRWLYFFSSLEPGQNWPATVQWCPLCVWEICVCECVCVYSSVELCVLGDNSTYSVLFEDVNTLCCLYSCRNWNQQQPQTYQNSLLIPPQANTSDSAPNFVKYIFPFHQRIQCNTSEMQ